jgi:DNA-binding NarL/FixJ family response regulator
VKDDVPGSAITVLCVDDHAIVREGITFIVDFQSDMRVIATAATSAEAIALFRLHRPDVTLMDLQLPDGDGVDAIITIRREFPDARIIVLSAFHGDDDVHRAFKAGAVAYVLKESISNDLIRVVREVHGGQKPTSPEIERVLSERTGPSLSGREREVLELMGTGMRNKEIAAALAISEGTVQEHIKRIFAKLKVNDRTAAVTIGLRRGIIHLTTGLS